MHQLSISTVKGPVSREDKRAHKVPAYAKQHTGRDREGDSGDTGEQSKGRWDGHRTKCTPIIYERAGTNPKQIILSRKRSNSNLLPLAFDIGLSSKQPVQVKPATSMHSKSAEKL